MNIFKKGDEVTVKNSCSGCEPGIRYILEYYYGNLVARKPDMRNGDGCACKDNWELLPNFTPPVYDDYRITEVKIYGGGGWGGGGNGLSPQEKRLLVHQPTPGGISFIKKYEDQIYFSKNVMHDETWDTGLIRVGLKTKVKNVMSNISNIAKKLFDADTKTLIEAGFLNSDLSMTAAGSNALKDILFIEKKKELVEAAKEVIAERKAANHQ